MTKKAVRKSARRGSDWSGVRLVEREERFVLEIFDLDTNTVRYEAEANPFDKESVTFYRIMIDGGREHLMTLPKRQIGGLIHWLPSLVISTSKQG